MNDGKRFLAWPGWQHLALSLKLACGVLAAFAVCYVGADWITAQHSWRVRWHFEFERGMPLFAPAAIVYLSLTPLMWASPFVLRTRREIVALATTLIAVTIPAGICFVLLPAEHLFDEPQVTGRWSGLVDFASRVALTNNFMPSLHVAYATICAVAYARRASRLVKTALGLWLLLLAASTLLLHQHYLIDVVGGFALALCGLRFVYRRWLDSGDRIRCENSLRQPVQ